MLLFNYVSPVVSEIADDASGVDGGVVLYDTDLNAANEERAQRAYSSVRSRFELGVRDSVVYNETHQFALPVKGARMASNSWAVLLYAL